MNKKIIIACLLAASVLMTAACTNDNSDTSSSTQQSDTTSLTEPVSKDASEEVSADESKEESKEESKMPVDKLEKAPLPENATLVTNLDYTNTGKMGDNDGPAVCVYAPEGYNKATLDIRMSEIRINTKRKSDGKHLNGYIFIGIDVLSEAGGYWINCFDAGLCYDGTDGKWRLFHNIYENTDPDEARWYTSQKQLNDTHDYRIELDSSFEDGKCTINIYDLTDDAKLFDTKTFTVKGLKCDGSNTAYYQDYALDYPNNVIVEPDGKVGSTYDKADWVKSTIHSTDENIFMQNINIDDAKLYKNGDAKQWDDGFISLWPDASVSGVDYACTTVVKGKDFYSYRIDLDMNRD